MQETLNDPASRRFCGTLRQCRNGRRLARTQTALQVGLRAARAVLGAGALLLAACRCTRGVDPFATDEILLDVPGRDVGGFAVAPDGAMFVAAMGTLFRASMNDPNHWDSVAAPQPVLMDVAPISAQHALVQYAPAGDILDWRADLGWSRFATPADTPQTSSGWTPRIARIRAFGPRLAYAVGEGALVMRYDGAVWSTVPRSGATPPSEDLWSVDVDGDQLVVAADRTRAYDSAAGWREIPRAAGANAGCRAYVVVKRADTLTIAGWDTMPCFWRAIAGRWARLPGTVPPFGNYMSRGAPQPGGSILVWSYAGDLVRIDARGLHNYLLPTFSRFAGAALRGGFLFYAGTREGHVVVSRRRLE